MATTIDRGETHITGLIGAVRRITGVPYLTYTDLTDPAEHSVGSVCFSTDLERLYINVGGTPYKWRYMTLT